MATFLPFIWAMLLVATLMVSWVLQLLGMFGNWIMVAAVAVYHLAGIGEGTRFAVDWPVVAAIIVLALLGELVEFIAGAWGVKKAGGSRRGAVLALVGSVIGGMAGLVVGVPVPVVGSLIAAVLFASLGALAGAMLGESWKGRPLDHSVEIGKAAFWGRMLGTLGKMLIGSVMLVVGTLAILLG